MTAVYHFEDGNWWVEDDRDPSWAGAGESLSEVARFHAELFGPSKTAMFVGAFTYSVVPCSLAEAARLPREDAVTPRSDFGI